MSLLLRRAANQSVVPPITIIDLGGDGGKRKAFEAERDNWQTGIRRIVEAAFSDVADDVATVTPEVRKAVKQYVRLEAKTEGIEASAVRIDALIAEYERLLRRQADEQEEEAIIMLLFAL